VHALLRTVFLPILLIGGLALALVVGPMELFEASKYRAWPTVDGSIVHTNINESLGPEGPQFRPVIQYRYQVDGRQYESDVVSSGDAKTFAERSDAEALLEEVSGDGTPLVHFNPERPEQAVLSLESRASAWAILLAGVLLLIGAAWVWRRIRLRAPPPPPQVESTAAD